MSKITLTDIASLQNEVSVVAAINNNNAEIEELSDTFLSRDGTAPNTMLSSLDMNSQRIINLPAPVSNTDPVRLQDIADDITVTVIDDSFNVSAFIETLLDDANAATARLTLLGAGTSGYHLQSTGSGSDWAGFAHSGSGASTRTWSAKVGESSLSVTDFGAVGDYDYDLDTGTDNTTAFNNAKAAAIANNIRTIRVPEGKYLISSGFSNTTEGLMYVGEGACYSDSDLERSVAGSKSIIIFDSSATPDAMFEWTLIADDDTDFIRRGGGMKDILLDGNNRATNALVVKSWMNLTFENVHSVRTTSYGWSLGTVSAGSTPGKYSSCYHQFLNCSHMALGSLGRAMVMWGANELYNTCLTKFIGCTWRAFVDLEDCDSNTFYGCAWESPLTLHADDTGSVGDTPYFSARNNYFFHCTGPITAKASVGGIMHSLGNVAYGYNMDLGASLPIIEAGARLSVLAGLPDGSLNNDGGAAYGHTLMGTKVTRAAVQAIPNETTTTIQWTENPIDYLDIFDAGSNTRLTVPNGIAYVRVSACADFTNNVNGERYIDIIANGVSVMSRATGWPLDSSLPTALNVDTGWVLVSPGDYFELRVYQSSGGSLDMLAGTTHMTMDVK